MINHRSRVFAFFKEKKSPNINKQKVVFGNALIFKELIHDFTNTESEKCLRNYQNGKEMEQKQTLASDSGKL